jgi:hypothetical protein
MGRMSPSKDLVASLLYGIPGIGRGNAQQYPKYIKPATPPARVYVSGMAANTEDMWSSIVKECTRRMSGVDWTLETAVVRMFDEKEVNWKSKSFQRLALCICSAILVYVNITQFTRRRRRNCGSAQLQLVRIRTSSRCSTQISNIR